MKICRGAEVQRSRDRGVKVQRSKGSEEQRYSGLVSTCLWGRPYCSGRCHSRPTRSRAHPQPSQLRRQDRRRKEAASRVEETVNDLVKETEPKSSEKNTEIELNVTEKLSYSEKNHTNDHN